MALEEHERALLQQGLQHVQAQDYFAAHDDWEEVWKELRGQPRVFCQAMIQLVVGAYHYDNGNVRGCQGQWHKALAKCDMLLQSYAAAEAPEAIQQLQELLLRVLTMLEHNTNPLPCLHDFAVQHVTVQWFECV